MSLHIMIFYIKATAKNDTIHYILLKKQKASFQKQFKILLLTRHIFVH